MKLRTKAAASVVLAASVLGGGIAEAASTGTNAGGKTFEWLCDITGGVYLGGEGVSHCFYRDGKIVACYTSTNRCVTYERNVLGSQAPSGMSMASR